MGKTFLSYSRKDEAFVEMLYRRLSRDGVMCFFDQESIAWGANWVLELEKAIDECEHIVLVLTPDFCTSQWTAFERTSAMADDPAGLRRKLRPLLLKPCTDVLPRFLKPIQSIEVTTTEAFERNYPRICRGLGGVIREAHLPEDRHVLPEVQPLPAKHRMSYRSLGEQFIARVAELWAVRDRLNQQKTAVVQGVGLVVGTGGLGKTQLAVEYVHRFGLTYTGGAFWVDMERERALMVDYIAEAAGLSIDGKLGQKERLARLWQGLSQGRPILVVFDNFPEGEPLAPWLPPTGAIHVLVTTRRRDLTNYSALSLNFMTVEEGGRLLNSGPRKFGEEAKDLVEALGGLPLALELARHYLNLRTDISIPRLLDALKQSGAMKTLALFTQKYADELPTGHSKAVAGTIQLSWDQASKFSQKVLQALSLLAPTSVPRRLIRRIFDPTLKIPSELTDPIDEALADLALRVALLERDAEGDVRVHRLIGAFVRETLERDADLQARTKKAVLAEMAQVNEEKDLKTYHEVEKILPHADLLLSQNGLLTPEESIDLSTNIRRHHQNHGRYRLAKSYGQQALEMAKAHFEPDHSTIAISQSNLALVLKDLGQLEEARDLLRAALASTEKNFEPGHPTIAILQSNLAAALKDLKEIKEAQRLFKEAYTALLKKFGPEHHLTQWVKRHLDHMKEN